MPGRNSQVTRIYAILEMLDAASRGLTITELAERLPERGHEASARTVRRDIEALSDAGFPLVELAGAETNAVRWGLKSRAEIAGRLLLSSRELLALYLARGALKPLTDTPFYEDLNTVFKKLEGHLGTKGRAHLDELANEILFEPGPKWGLGIDADTLKTVHACCAEKHVLSVVYDSANSSPKRERKLGPHFLYFAKGSLYLVAEDLQTREPKIFSVPRMTDAKMLETEYRGTAIDPEIFFKSSFGIFKGNEPQSIELEISPKIAPFIRERRWHQSQSIVAKGNGSIALHMDVAITPELVQWVLSLGPEAKVLSPQELKTEVAQAAAKVAALYKAA